MVCVCLACMFRCEVHACMLLTCSACRNSCACFHVVV